LTGGGRPPPAATGARVVVVGGGVVVGGAVGRNLLLLKLSLPTELFLGNGLDLGVGAAVVVVEVVWDCLNGLLKFGLLGNSPNLDGFSV